MLRPHHFGSLGAVLAGAFCVAGIGPAAAIERTAWIEDMGLEPGAPLVTLPSAAGAVIGIDEQRKTESYTQTLTFQGDAGTVGENRVVVTVTRNGLAPRTDDDKIYAEMADALPDLPMALGPIGTRNRFGYFGSAIGHKGALTCFYGWQGINLADKWISGHRHTPLEEQHALSIRVRLCRTTLDAAGLTALMQGADSGIRPDAVAPGGLGYDALAAAAGATGLSPNEARPLARPTVIPAYGPEPTLTVRRRTARLRRRPLRAEEPSEAPSPLPGMPAVPEPEAAAE